MYRKILVALDGSEPSNNALEHAATIAKKFDAELILVAEGHHALSLSRNYGPVAQRQSELAHRSE